jgi:hypothetical protein
MADQPDWTVGFQNVASSTTLYNATPLIVGHNPFQVPVDMSAWASIYIAINVEDNTGPISWFWKDPFTNIVIPGGQIYCANADDIVQVQIPVVNSQLFFGFASPGVINPQIQIVGSTQVINKPNYMDWPSQAFSRTAVWVAGTLLGLGAFNSSGGECYLYARSIGAANKGFIGYQVALTGALNDTELLTDTGEWHTDASGSLAVGKYVTLPPGICNLIWLPETSGNYTVTALLNPTKT